MSTSPQPVSTGDIGTLLSQSMNSYFSRLVPYLVASGIILVPAYILNGIISALTWRAAVGAFMAGGFGAALGGSFLIGLLTGFIGWLAFGLVIGLVAKMAQAQLAGKTPDVAEAFKAVPLGGLIATAALFGVATAIGWALLILPGVAVWFFFCLALPCTALDKAGAIDAFTRSAKAVLKVPAEVIVVLVIFVAYFFIAALILTPMALLGAGFVIKIVSGIFYAFVAPWLGIALTLCYEKAKKLGA